MNLCQEYLERHSIELPVVQHSGNGYVFLKSKNKKGRINWSVVTISFQDGKYHPGTYLVNWSKPMHNGYGSRNRVFDSYEQRQLEWDEYEGFFLDWTKSLKNSRVVEDHKEILVVAWEMFVYANDQNLLSYAHREDFFNSIDDELSLDERYEACESMIEVMMEDPHVGNTRRCWDREIMVYVRGYSHWLAELSNAQN